MWGVPDKYCKLETTFFNSPIFIGTIEKQAPVSLFYLESHLAPRLKVLPGTSLLQLLFTAMVKQLHFFLTFHHINYNHIIISSFPLPKDSFSIQKDSITLKVHLILGFAIYKFASSLLGITPSLCLERDVSSTPTCTGRCLGYISCCNGLPLQGKYDLCTQMTSYQPLHLLKSLGT